VRRLRSARTTTHLLQLLGLGKEAINASIDNLSRLSTPLFKLLKGLEELTRSSLNNCTNYTPTIYVRQRFVEIFLKKKKNQ
jgi:hypothetical protein